LVTPILELNEYIKQPGKVRNNVNKLGIAAGEERRDSKDRKDTGKSDKSRGSVIGEFEKRRKTS
jgi:hypothetical protein